MKAVLYMGLILLVLIVGCNKEKPPRMSAAEPPPTGFFTDEIDRALQELHAIEQDLDTGERTRLGAHIQTLQTKLTQLRFYYLPLLQVRELAYSAYRSYHLDQSQDADLQLQKAKRLLEAVAVKGDPTLKAEMENLINRVFHVEEAFRIRPERVQERFEDLIHGLDIKAIKGRIVLGGSHEPVSQE